jgi:cytochrome c oxidase subunit IV
MADTVKSTGHEAHPEPNYWAVIIVLGVATLVEILLTYAPMPKLFIGILLVGFALFKAIIVAAFFMHLKFEKTTLALIAATPLLLCTLLIFALLPDHNPKNHLSKSGAPVTTEPASPAPTPAH